MSIREVAARAGVSTATVSRVFSRPEAVAADTRHRVMTAAEELQYSPHPAASSLAGGRTGNLGIVVPDIANSFSAVVIKAVDRQARREGYALFVAGSEEVVHDEEASARALVQQVDGLLLVSPRMPDDALLALAGATPVVVLNRLLDGIPAVLTNLYEATRHAVEHLHALGHRTVVYLAGPDGYPNDVRLRGFRDACGRLGMEGSEIGPFAARFQAGVRAADLVLATSATAVVAYNDDIGVGVINRLADRGVHVPADISVVGFDDTQLAEVVTPRLTTVRIPAADAGTAAIEMLLDLVRGRDVTVRSPRQVSAELVVRSSTGPVRAVASAAGQDPAP
ncbi:LacI family transcriptional regulator [Geodermatophilus sp. YIM 151500]|uniref:LacI family DNA-binding transcriptional regulator n=1 Tax=Geodermatophilus sp. YIM 151500 TaxID=2984531 RepID=UPI0021E4B628|nr:LacI family DNA-binding transcriptional regulator [Geodermatophilus sp. YIM 151500]MCV2490297.1 LacI family transcriptional regulator [Geodermatophilus sp. YIM 151500]